MNRSIRLQIGGMTCVNCQNKIEKKLQNTPGVVSASVSYNNASADIVYDREKLTREEIVAAIESLDYEVLSGRAAGPSIVNVICMLAIIVALYVMLQSLGILNLLVPSQLADTTMGYGMLFVIGLITSVHCIAMCGGINLSQCIPQSGAEGAHDTGRLPRCAPPWPTTPDGCSPTRRRALCWASWALCWAAMPRWARPCCSRAS